MTDEALPPAASAVASWFVPAAVAAILFEAIGVATYLFAVLRDKSTLPLVERLLWIQTPAWIIGAYAIAVWSGLAGAIGLTLRRTWSIPLLGLSLLAVLVQVGGSFFVPQLRGLTQPGAMITPLAIVAASAAIYALAHLAHRRGWLR
jgi:hypothetical protein